MRKIPFTKYTCFGNNFVIVDETRGPVLSEQEKMKFAHRATDGNFGVGSDNFLVIQRCTREVLEDINHAHHYWENHLEAGISDYVFRIFEPNGVEAFCCGNGLLCMADYLYHRYDIKSARIMTQIPTASPKVIPIGTELERGVSWVNLGHPERMPSNLVDRSMIEPYDNEIDMVREVEITKFRQSDGVSFFGDAKSLTLSGYLVFTGEPHLVIFAENGFSLNQPAEAIFTPGGERNDAGVVVEKRKSTSSSLVHFIGKYFGRVYSNLFPAGININFARCIQENSALEYRCFERGINRETLACGTGALATAFVAHRLGKVDSDRITVLPHRCRWHDENAEIQIAAAHEGWQIHGRPVMLFEGMFALQDWKVEEKECVLPFNVQVAGSRCRYRHMAYN